MSLELDISRNGLKVPLIVEEKGENQYVLVDGYRRYFALDFLKIEAAECIVETYSSEEERIVKRLSKELHTKRRTAYQLERMIKRLLENEKYDIPLIASLCNVTEGTIRKYVRGADIDPEWFRIGEENNLGRHTLTEIHNLNINQEVINDIFEKYKEKQINKSTVHAIKKAIKEKAFMDILGDNVKMCMDEIIDHKNKEYEAVRAIVYEYSLQAGYTKESHTFIHRLILSLLSRVEKIFHNKNYVDYLTTKQKKEIRKLLCLFTKFCGFHSIPEIS
ncbi:ParB/RepB/Spo0J family partition protein [Neobacillus thermocopriae]|uniref:ParB/RepB/Spo0J family partition protein n=1 Tax=Neobacillus thermocopriae TaxID=1215031 RepID=UPI003770328E